MLCFFPSCIPRQVPGSSPGFCGSGLGRGGDGFRKTLSGQLGGFDAASSCYNKAFEGEQQMYSGFLKWGILQKVDRLGVSCPS